MTKRGIWDDTFQGTWLSNNQASRRRQVTAVLIDGKPVEYEMMPDRSIRIVEPVNPRSDRQPEQ